MSRTESKNEPSDGLRVVNALLTQIDQLKKFRNVLVLATSNLRNRIDDAFLDRADVSYEVGLPGYSTLLFQWCTLGISLYYSEKILTYMRYDL